MRAMGITLTALAVWASWVACGAAQVVSQQEQVLRQAELVAGLKANLQRAQEVRLARQRGFLDTLYEVEKAAIPVPDDPPIRYPDPETWREITRRRGEGYSTTGPNGERHTPAEQKIYDALKSPTTLDFDGVSLESVADYLKDLHGIEIQVDRRALRAAGVPGDVPVTRHIDGVSLKSALNLMLRDLDLTHVVQDEVLLITTPQQAATRLKTRVYRVPWASDRRYFRGGVSTGAVIRPDGRPGGAWLSVGPPGSQRPPLWPPVGYGLGYPYSHQYPPHAFAPPAYPRIGFLGHMVPGRPGVVVTSVDPGSPAARIGLWPGDVILGVNGRPLDYAGAYEQAMAHAAVHGRHATLRICDRFGRLVTRTVRLF